MRAGAFLLLLLFASLQAGAARPTTSVRDERTALSAEEFVAARQVSMDMSDYVMSGMKDAVARQRAAKTQVYSATTLNKWATILPRFFPVPTGPGKVKADTAAKAVIWTDRTGFLKAAADYQQATAELIVRAKADDAQGFKEQLSRVNDACNTCHGTYRVPEE